MAILIESLFPVVAQDWIFNHFAFGSLIPVGSDSELRKLRTFRKSKIHIKEDNLF